MSVTFFVAQAPTSYTVECSCSAYVYPHTFDSYTEAAIVQTIAVSECTDDYCGAYPMSVCVGFPFSGDVNVSNFNAKAVLDVLGFGGDEDGELAGAVDGSDFLGRVLTAQALNPADAGVPATQEGNVIYCGRPEGYMEDVLARLHPIAQHAADTNQEVAWG